MIVVFFLGKKGKKSKGKAVPLQDFLAVNSGNVGSSSPSPAAKKLNWAEDDDEDYIQEKRSQLISLPTAPRASRILTDDSIPQDPPYLSYVSNLPYDVNEGDIHEFFGNLEVVNIRLPRDEGDSGRLRGFGYIEFGTRDDLIDAVRMPDPVIRNRRIRIDISNENDQKRMAGGSNWRQRGGDRGGDREGGENRRGFSFRDRAGREGGENPEENTNWRAGDRPRDASPQQRRGGDRGGGRDRDGGDRGGRDRDGGGYNDNEGFKRRGGGDRDRDGGRDGRDGGGRREYGRDRGGGGSDDNEQPKERPKLNLQPRTLPIEALPQPAPEDQIDDEEAPPVVIPKAAPVPAAAIFGSAKPVDTAAKEREIEERLEKERLAKKKEKEEEREREKEKQVAEAAAVAATVDPDAAVDEKKSDEIISWRRRADEKEDDNDKGNTQQRKHSPHRKDGGGGGQMRRGGDRNDRNDHRGGDRNDRNDHRGGDRNDRNDRGGDRNDRMRDNRDRDNKQQHRGDRNNKDYRNNR